MFLVIHNGIISLLLLQGCSHQRVVLGQLVGKDVDVVPNLNEGIVHFQDQLGSVQIWVLLEDALASKVIDILAYGDLSDGERR